MYTHDFQHPWHWLAGGNALELWTIVAAVSAVIANVISVLVARTSLRKADAALEQSRINAELSLQRADLALEQAQQLSRESLQAHWAIDGAMSAIAWRDQVIELHDRGLTAERIRRIMLLEDGGAGYEASNGHIDDILRGMPRRPQ
ncbi:hypothetical protein OG496_33400 [Streptomyces sp. NBC_00988]|uniref:hypothetical protein n=1 Tax=Streptomyces sp. NBC_00988 TaxID=2903704 RepID=UPI00386DBA5A|nr:hypothetical protein OG496_33400 [Streptomyces sp. NBC_00988]